jgi:hypothetical protein
MPYSAAAAAAEWAAGGLSGSTADLALGPVVAAAAHVPSRAAAAAAAVPSGGGKSGAGGGQLCSAVSGLPIRSGTAVLLDEGLGVVTLSEAIAIRRLLTYSPGGSGRPLMLPT